MRTKEEITKKKSYASDTPADVEPEPADKNLKRKRFFIILTIFLTIGLSLSFIIYRQVRMVLSRQALVIPSLPKIYGPESPLTATSSDTLTTRISKVVTTNQDKWNITTFNNDVIYNWPKNTKNIELSQIKSMISRISKQPQSNLISDLIPQGLSVREESGSDNQFQKLSVLISPPNQTLFFIIEYQGSAKEFQDTLSQLIPTLYWGTIHSQP